MARDVTWFVRKHGYFPSYNIPFFKKMYKLGGWEKEEQKADWFSWERAPRARIMRRDHHRVVDIETLTRLMRCSAGVFCIVMGVPGSATYFESSKKYIQKREEP